MFEKKDVLKEDEERVAFSTAWIEHFHDMLITASNDTSSLADEMQEKANEAQAIAAEYRSKIERLGNARTMLDNLRNLIKPRETQE